MSDIEYLFSYGTLQQANVQQETFGRLLKGVQDSLPGFVVGEVRILDAVVVQTSGKEYHPMLQFTDHDTDVVEGMFFEVTHDELLQADGYEVEQYRRVRARLGSGVMAWIYADAEDSRLV